MELEFSSSDMLLTRSSVIEFFSGPFTKRKINAFNLDFIKVVSKSLSKSDSLFGLLRKFRRIAYTVLLSTIGLQSNFYKSLARLRVLL